MPKYTKGQSGNPAGRAKGVKDWRGRLREMIEGPAPEIVEKVIEQALRGDTNSQRMLLDRLIPVRKPADEPVKLVDLTPATLTKQGETVINAALRGQIAPERAAALMSALTQQVRIAEAEDFQRRLTELEKRIASPEGNAEHVGERDCRPRRQQTKSLS